MHGHIHLFPCLSLLPNWPPIHSHIFVMFKHNVPSDPQQNEENADSTILTGLKKHFSLN